MKQSNRSLLILCTILLVLPAMWFTANAQNISSSSNNIDKNIAISQPKKAFPIRAKTRIKKHYARTMFFINQGNQAKVSRTKDAIIITFESPIRLRKQKQILQSLESRISSFSFNKDSTILTIIPKDPKFRMRNFAGKNIVGIDILPEKKIKRKPAITAKTVKERHKAQKTLTASDKSNKKPPSNDTPPKKSNIPDNALHVSVRSIANDGVRLTFPFKAPTEAAIYGRYDKIWIIYKTDRPSSFHNVKGVKYFKKVEQQSLGNYQVTLIHLAPGYLAQDFPTINQNALSQKYTRVFVAAKRDKSTWHISLADAPFSDGELEGTSVKLTTGEIEVKDLKIDQRPPNHILIDTKADVTPFIFTDSVLGDNLHIFTSLNHIHLRKKRHLVDSIFLKTAQGLVIKKITDSLQIQLNASTIELVSKGGFLNLSPELYNKELDEDNSIRRARKVKISTLAEKSILPFKRVLLDRIDDAGNEEIPITEESILILSSDLDEIDEQLAALEEELQTTTPAQKGPYINALDEEKKRLFNILESIKREQLNAEAAARKDDDKLKKIARKFNRKKSILRLDIARLFFSEGLYAEAVGMLAVNQELDKDFARNSPESDAIMGAAQYMLGRYSDAFDIFSKLVDDTAVNDKQLSEYIFWQWASRFKRSQVRVDNEIHDLPVTFVEANSRFMELYPPSVAFEFGLSELETRILLQDLAATDTILRILKGFDKDVVDINGNNIRFYEAKKLALEGKYTDAEFLWKELSYDVEDRYNRARSVFEMVRVKLLNGEMSVDQAVAQFDKIDLVWRGDLFEFNLLKLIGQLYLKNGDYLKGLRAWHLLVKLFPHSKESLYIAGKMKKYFVKLFDKGLAYELEPFDALALYSEFRELTPIGTPGDNIIQQLVDHFVNADLLDNATNILYHQVRFRAKGKNKQKLALRLARLHLRNKDPASALDALTFIKGDIPQNLANTVRYLKANALLQQENTDEVFKLLNQDFSKKAQDIRLDIFWKARNWFGLIRILEDRLDDIRNTAPTNLTSSELNDIIRLCVAYAAQEHLEKYDRLRTDFSNRIPRKVMGDVFDFVTTQIQPLDHKNYSNTVQLDQIESFINDYVYWPKKDWPNAATVLEAKVEPYAKPYTREQMMDIARLGIAYSQIQNKTPEREKAYSDFLRKYGRDVTIDRDTIHAFSVFDDPYLPVEHDAIFDQKINMANSNDVKNNYLSIRKISDLNALYR